MKKFIIIIIIIAVAGLIGFSLITKQTSKKPELKTKINIIKTNQQQQNLRQATMRIDGMWCASCATGAEYALKEKEGVINASVDYDSKIGNIVYNSLKISKDELIQAVKPYTATITKDIPYK